LRDRHHVNRDRNPVATLVGPWLPAGSLAMLRIVGIESNPCAFINQIVGIASVPSIVLRVTLGAVIVWLIPARNGVLAQGGDAPRPPAGTPVDGRWPRGPGVAVTSAR
jgi:hypothetical protein